MDPRIRINERMAFAFDPRSSASRPRSPQIPVIVPFFPSELFNMIG